MKSIRNKLFLSISLLLVFFILLLWFLNNQYLNEYYLNKKRNTLIKTAKEIQSIYKGNIINVQLELDRLANITSSNIDIRSSKDNFIYSSTRIMEHAENQKQHIDKQLNPQPNPPPLRKHFVKYSKGVYTIDIIRDDRMQIEIYTLGTVLNNGDILSIGMPLLSIKENVDIANTFILFTGGIIIVLGSLLAFIFSRKFTKPILELNFVAQKIAKFDFSKKCSVTGKDELGQLGRSINHLSSELDNAITELNVKNKKLEEDIDRERKIDEMRKEFISSVSHELRTPISVIQGYAEGLVSNVAESEEDKKFYCDVIMKEADKMSSLVKDLLDVSQIESGYFKLEETEFDLTSLIRYVVNRHKAIIAEKNIVLDFDVKDEIFVFGDMMRIEQILTNYLTNAINHVEADSIGRKLININLSALDEKIRVNVFNTGKQIPKDSLEQIWNSFYKVDKARTRAYGGYGLGLSIVKAIQEHHGNAFGAINEENGVTFWFDINKSKSDIKE